MLELNSSLHGSTPVWLPLKIDLIFFVFPHPIFFFIQSVFVRFTPTFSPISSINSVSCVCVCHPKGAQPAKKKKKEKMEDQSVFASAEEVDDLWVE